MTQSDSPDWGPLLRAVGEDVTGDFMWMFEVQLADGRRLQAYKHIDTRGYVHLDNYGGAFAYEAGDRYRSVGLDAALIAVFAALPGLAISRPWRGI